MVALSENKESGQLEMSFAQVNGKLSTLHLEDGSFVDENLKSHVTDLLLPDNLRGNIMTIAEQLRQQGIEKTVIGFLKAGAPEEMVSKATGLSREQVKKTSKGNSKRLNLIFIAAKIEFY